MEARRTFGGASGSRQLVIMVVAILVAAALAVAAAFLAKGLSAGNAPAGGSTVKTYIDSPKDFPDRQTHVVVTKPDAPRTWHARPGMI